MGKSKAPPAPAPVDASKAMGEYLFGKGFSNYQGVTDPALQQRLLQAEQTYRPQYAALELSDINAYLLGTQGKQGVLDLTAEATRRSSALDREAQALQRQQEIDILGKYGQQTVDALRAADPQSRAIAEAQQQFAMQAAQRAGLPVSDANYDMQQSLARSAFAKAETAPNDPALAQARALAANAAQTATSPQTSLVLEQQKQFSDKAYQNAVAGVTDPILAAQQKLALDAYANTGKLGFEAQRAADQQAFAMGQAAGRTGDNSVIASQILNRQAAKDQRALMAQQAGQLAFGMGGDLFNRNLQNSQMAMQAGKSTFDMEGYLANQRMQQLQMAGLLGQNAYGISSDLFNRDLQNRQFAQQSLGTAFGMGGDLSNRQAQSLMAAQQAGAQAFGYNRALAGDVANILIGRPSTAYAMGSQATGQGMTLAGQPTGPNLFDPNAGVNLALQNQSNLGNYQSAIFGAKAGREGAIIGGGLSALGSMAGAASGAAILGCWVAREVYGEDNPKWKVFRSWLSTEAPLWLFQFYCNNGERFAAFIKDKPAIKWVIRKLMDLAIKGKQ